MSSINLIILGFLRHSPMSAYDITRHFEFKKVQKWVKVGSPTVYQNIKKLAARNYLTGKTIKEGEMPEKVIYRLTDDGEKYFLELMDQFSSTPGKVFFDFNAVIANLGQVDHATAVAMLKKLRRSFQASQTDVNKDYGNRSNLPPEGGAIMDLYRIVFKGMIEWVEGLIEEYQENEKKA